ncbi:cyclic pyranopterin phosphate synthase MoaA [Hahella sp. CCB-MM4]|uniref:GTP 3',8-cyclase MoaA n=1 Tax=Hahella sp. (strain CCB-MM4) TaxID=1926491 RepID=UPI000B9C01FD|nr:GTP 3',8-cyclase MoaA [Hahella sp. CCB-MM4]OZG71974.1 cyclic pyranopterin phosphate synthase MoaA [Hahella sp. CCB-MM4]
MTTHESANSALIDRFGRQVNYVRLSVTDRCDFRCVYCMAEDMTFLPRQQILTLEELYDVARAFVSLGVKKIRLTGGEPLVRKNILSLIERLGQLEGLDELVLTTNGSQLPKMAKDLKAFGVKRINISLDSLDPVRFRELTRTGDLSNVIAGIDAARDAGFERIKINAVIMRGRNEDEVLNLVNFARERKLDLSFIEEMPLGNITEHDRQLAFISSSELRDIISATFPLHPVVNDASTYTGGPSEYYSMSDSAVQLGFISPHSHNFCHLCNRVRVTVEGRLLLCLGNEHSVDLKEILRAHPGDSQLLKQSIREAMNLKPERHYFSLEDEPQIVRFMNMTGG